MNRQKFEALYSKVLEFWPSEIDVSKKKIFPEGGATIPNLVVEHDKAEAMASKHFSNESQEVQTWAGLIDWSLYTILHKSARVQGCRLVKVHEVSADDVISECLKNDKYASDWEL